VVDTPVEAFSGKDDAVVLMDQLGIAPQHMPPVVMGAPHRYASVA
jgi:hypothetical protein